MSENIDQKTYWNEVAGAKWVANQERLDRLMAPLTEVLYEAAKPAESERILDIGCGCGDIALRMAEAVGPSGKVLGIDVSKPMLAHASSRSQGLSLEARAPIAWHAADAMTYVFEPAYDLLVSRFGIMFFEDRLRAFTNLRQAAKPAARFAFLTWRRRQDVEWFQAPLDWVETVLPMPAPSDGEIGPCALADEKATCTLLREAGFGEVEATPIDRPLQIGATADEALSLLKDAGPVAASLRESDPKEAAAAEQLLRARLESFAGPVILGGACWLYSGRA